MSAIDTVFEKLRTEGRTALVPFITAGDPDLDFTAKLLHTFSANGASVCEIGIPYSDPVADGPVIQASYTRALDRGIRVGDILRTLGRVAEEGAVPLVTMVSYSIVLRHGLQKYVDLAKSADVSGAIVPDLPVEEAEPLAKICRAADFSLIQLVTPTTPRDRALRIAETSSGFLYYVSTVGITGERTNLPPELAENVAWLREKTPLPICIGFGISGPEQVRQLAPVADGLIVGSAFVRRIARAATEPRDKILDEVRRFTTELCSAM